MCFITQTLKQAALLGALLISAALPARAEEILLQSAQNDKYAGFANGYLAARSSVARAQHFDLIRLGNARVALRDPASGRYLRAGAAGADLALLEWGDMRRDDWETFILGTQGGTFTLRSVANGKYVRAGIGSQTYFGATSAQARGWEAFRIIATDIDRGGDQWILNRIVGQWRIHRLLDTSQVPIPFDRATLQGARLDIQQGGRFSFTAGCNTVSGRINAVREDLDGLVFSNILSTRMRCANSAEELEHLVARMLEDMRFAETQPNRLMLFYANRATMGMELIRR